MEAAADYLSNNADIAYDLGLWAVQAGVLYTAYHLVAGNTEPYREEAKELSNEELASEIIDLEATYIVNDYGPEMEGSWEEGMIFFDILRPKRQLKKKAYAEEAKDRGGEVTEILEDCSPNQNSPLTGIPEMLGDSC